MSSVPTVTRTFVNQERLIGTADYGTEFLFWHVMERDRFVPVRKAEGAALREREGWDRLPPGVISRVTVEVALPAGTPVLLLVRRPKAMTLPRRERRTYWLTRHGRLSRHPPTQFRASSRESSTERLPVAQRAELARNLVALLDDDRPRTPR